MFDNIVPENKFMAWPWHSEGLLTVPVETHKFHPTDIEPKAFHIEYQL
jgi:hypothetical protein